jgi:ASC-1-like (ASCH) protein
MDQLAIMNPKWKLIEKILAGEKTVESRWYKTKRAPWNKIITGEKIYFKDSGRRVTVMAMAGRIWQFEDLDEGKIRKILKDWHQEIGFDEADIERNVEYYQGKKYCILVEIVNPKRVDPFEIDKTGFGTGSAWLTVKDIKQIKR